MNLSVKTLLLALLPCFAYGQSLERQLVATTGNFAQTTTGSLSFTIGEPVVVLGTSSSNSLLQGFQQPTYAPRTSVFQNSADENCKFVLYPNPVSHFAQIDTDLKDVSFEIFDVTGKSYGHFFTLNGAINVSSLLTGIYFVKFNCDSDKIYYRKLVKE